MTAGKKLLYHAGLLRIAYDESGRIRCGLDSARPGLSRGLIPYDARIADCIEISDQRGFSGRAAGDLDALKLNLLCGGLRGAPDACVASSAETIARLTGMRPSKVPASLARLSHLGLIEADQRAIRCMGEGALYTERAAAPLPDSRGNRPACEGAGGGSSAPAPSVPFGPAGPLTVSPRLRITALSIDDAEA